MKRSNLFFSAMLALIVAMGLPAGQVMAGWEGIPPDTGEKLVGPEMWGVVIIETTTKAATLRVKKIEDCAVDTDPQKATLSSTPASAADALYVRLGSGTVFGLPCIPIITQVKNYKDDTVDGLITFDCQIKFVVPIGYPGAKCE